MADPDTVRDAAAGKTDRAAAPDKPTGLGTGSWLAGSRVLVAVGVPADRAHAASGRVY